MADLAKICVTSTAEGALKKLKRANIAVFNCKKRGADFIFCVKDKDVKKAFAIFAKPCYNIRIERNSAKNRILSYALARVGIIAGAIIFAVAAFISNFYILRIEVVGSGHYLEGSIREIMLAEGAKEGKPFSALDTPLLTGKILALPQVTFCNLSKRGSVLSVNVEVDNSYSPSSSRKALIADVGGTVINIVAICGTAAVQAGDRVERGDTLIFAYAIINEEKVEGIAAGYAEIEYVQTREYFAPDESEQSIKEAYAACLIEGETILSRSHKIYPSAEGVLVEIEVRYLHTISLNLS